MRIILQTMFWYLQVRSQVEFVWLHEFGVVCYVVHHYLWRHRKSGGRPRTAHGCGVSRPGRGVCSLGDGIPVVWRALPHCCQVHKNTENYHDANICRHLWQPLVPQIWRQSSGWHHDNYRVSVKYMLVSKPILVDNFSSVFKSLQSWLEC